MKHRESGNLRGRVVDMAEEVASWEEMQSLGQADSVSLAPSLTTRAVGADECRAACDHCGV